MARWDDSGRVDPDVDLRVPVDRSELSPRPWPVLLAVSAGGVIGAGSRWAFDVALPHRPGSFPWATFGINILGSLLIGVVMVLVTEVWGSRPLLRPFLAVGLLGGFTTFSTYVVDIRQTVAGGSPGIALLYLVGTPLAALLAVWVGTTIAAGALAGAGRAERAGRTERGGGRGSADAT